MFLNLRRQKCPLLIFFNADVKFIKRGNGKTPDFLIKGVYWELKSPTGSGKHNIQHKIQDAAEQSRNIIIDGRKSKLHPIKLRNEIQHQFNIIKKSKTTDIHQQIRKSS